MYSDSGSCSQAGIPLKHLTATQNRLIFCLRLWANQCANLPTVSTKDWRHHFESMGLPQGAIQSFDALMNIVFSTSGKAPHIRYYNSPLTSDDECWLLACFALAQQEQWQHLALALGGRLTNSDQKLLITLFHFVATALHELGLSLSGTDQKLRSFWLDSHSSYSGYFNHLPATVH